MRTPRFTLLQLLLASALVALVLGLFTSVWRACSVHEVRSLHFSPSGKLLAAHYESGAIQIWRLEERGPRRVALLPPRGLLDYDFSMLHFVSEDRLVRLDFRHDEDVTVVEAIDLARPGAHELARLEGSYHSHAPSHGVTSQHLILNNWVYAGLFIYCLQDGESQAIATDRRVGLLALSANGQRIAAGDDSAIEVFEIESGESLHRLATAEYSEALALSADGRILAFEHFPSTAAQASAAVALRDVATGEQRLLFTRLDEIDWIAFSRDGRRLAAGGWPYVVEVYDLANSDQRLCRIAVEPSYSFHNSVTFSPDGEIIATHREGLISLWDASTGNVTHAIAGDSRTLQTVIFTLGFALWAAAWGIVRKRERVRKGHASGKPADRPPPQPIGPPPRPELSLAQALPDLAWLLVLTAFLVGIPIVIVIWTVRWSFEVTVETMGFVLAVLVFMFLLAPIWVGLRRLAHGPHHAYLARLRAIVRDEGRLHEFGRLRIWCSGRTYSEPEFARVYEECVRRAGALFGEMRELSRPSLVAVLDWQADYDAFFGRHLPAAAAAPNQWTERVVVLCEETSLASLEHPVAALRAALATLLQVEHKGDVLHRWLGQFAALPLLWDDELPAQRRGAARRLKVLFARRPDWSPQNALLRTEDDRLRLWMEGDHVEACREVVAEGDVLFALADALLSDDAPAERRQAVLGWLRKIRPHDEPLAGLQRDCGLALDDLTAIVRDWAHKHAKGAYDPMPRFKRHVMQTVHVPAIHSAELPLALRQWIVHALGTCGYAGAAGPLLPLVADPASPLREEAIAACENLAGELRGADAAQWQAWWNAVPPEVKPPPLSAEWQDPPRQELPRANADCPAENIDCPEASLRHPTGNRDRPTREIDHPAKNMDRPAGEVHDWPPALEAEHPALPAGLPCFASAPAPAELAWVWGLMAVGGLVALALPIGFLFAAGPVVFPTVYLGLLVGIAAVSRAAARDEAGLVGTATLQALNLLACDPVNPIIAAFELHLLNRPHVQSYLLSATSGALQQHAAPLQ